MKLTFTFVLLLVIISNGQALPRFALRGGEASCRGCHVDPTGGRLRTEGGDNFAQNRLAMWPTKDKFSANIGEGIRIGVDMRSQFLYFADHVTMPGFDTTRRASGGLEMALPVYVSAKLSEATQAFVKVDPVSSEWEGYGIIHYVHSSGEFLQSNDVIGDAYFKVGAFIPAYGIRFDDHTVYTRGGNAELSGFGPAGMIWQHNYKDEGFELGFELFDHVFLTADVLNGNEMATGSQFKIDPFGPYALSFRGVVNTGPLLDGQLSAEAGASLYVHSVQHTPFLQPADTTAQTRLLAFHGGIHFGPFSLLAEADAGRFVFHNITFPGMTPYYSDTSNALAFELAADLTKGVTGMVRFDNYSEYNAAGSKTNIKTRLMVGMQWFPVRFLEFRPEFRVARGTVQPTSDPASVQDVTETTALLQTHIFF